MELRDLISKIDSIQIEAAYQSPTNHNPAGYDEPYSMTSAGKYPAQTPTKQPMQPQAPTTEIIQRLRNLLSRAQNIKNTQNISEALIKEFSYLYEENEPPTSLWQKAKSGAGYVAKKLATPALVLYSIWDAWEQITALPRSLTKQEAEIEITKIVSKLVAEYGMLSVGATLGAILAGVYTGPFAPFVAGVGAVGGAITAEYMLGDDVEAIVDKIVDYLYENEGTSTIDTQVPQDNTTEKTKPSTIAPSGDPDVIELQTMLQQAGATNPDGSELTISGVMDSNTISAMQRELISLGASLTQTGVIDDATATAIKKYYLMKGD